MFDEWVQSPIPIARVTFFSISLQSMRFVLEKMFVSMYSEIGAENEAKLLTFSMASLHGMRMFKPYK